MDVKFAIYAGSSLARRSSRAAKFSTGYFSAIHRHTVEKASCKRKDLKKFLQRKREFLFFTCGIERSDFNCN
jgi:hypothetical protein